MKILYAALVLVIFILILKLKGRKICGPKCKISSKTFQSKKQLTYKERLAEIKKRIKKKKKGGKE